MSTIPHNTNTLNSKTILIVNTGSLKKRFILQKIKKLGLTTVVLNKEKNWAQPYVDHWILADNTNHSEALQAVNMFISSNPKIKIDGAITFWEDDVLLTSKIIDKFNFIGIPYSIARKVRNKFLFREFCLENDLPTPKKHIVRNNEDLEYVHNKFNFPLVLKPAYGSGSAFVVKVENKEYLYDMYHYVRNNISSNIESALHDGLDIFVEEFIDGDEVDIDMLLQNGKMKFYAISDNYNKSKGIFFVDSGQSATSSLPLHAQNELMELAETTLEKLGIQNGCIHFEAKYSNKGPYPIEINVRMGGDYVYSYIKGAWNVDLIEYAVRIAIGEYFKIEKPMNPKKYIIGWDLHPQSSGILVELDVNEEDIKKYKYIEEVQIYKEIGDTIFIPPDGFENIGWMTVSGENMLDAQDNLENALKLITYKVVKFDHSSFLGKTERKDRFSPAVLNKNLLIRAVKFEAIKRIDLKNLKNLHIGILGNINQETRDPIEIRLNEVTRAIEKVLKNRGYNITVFNLNNFPDIIDQLRKADVNLVFNIGERLHNVPEYKAHIVSILDSLQIPYTGSDPFTLSLAVDKIRFKKLLTYHEFPTPYWDYLYDMDEEIKSDLTYPLIIKPANTDHSIGISNSSVVTNKKELYDRLEKIIKEMGRPALVEEYIEGDEYEIYILGNSKDNLKVLPLCRTIFDKLDKDLWHMYTFESKWLNDGNNEKIVRQLPPKNISKKLQSLITEMALDTYNIFDCRDYGKVEIKVDKDNNPYVIELNPNPWLYNYDNMGIVASAKLAGVDYGALLEEIICLAIARYKRQPISSIKPYFDDIQYIEQMTLF